MLFQILLPSDHRAPVVYHRKVSMCSSGETAVVATVVVAVIVAMVGRLCMQVPVGPNGRMGPQNRSHFQHQAPVASSP